jgi:hypothetical protein
LLFACDTIFGASMAWQWVPNHTAIDDVEFVLFE